MMARMTACACVVVAGLLACNGVAEAQYDVYSSGVPDVDKPAPGDNSCWLASAANALAAGGWGSGATAQQRATNIYTSDLMPHFGNGVWTGWSSVAINWWLLNHGYNPGSANYAPTVDYNDATVVIKRLQDVDYDGLLDELNQTPAQQVSVTFEIPNASVGHEMTLVGGNYSLMHMPPGMPQVSVWHDNQGDLTPPPGDDDEYGNTYIGPFWNIDRKQTPDNPNDDWEAIGATILCPGLQKPDEAIRNFDIAYYKDMIAPGTLVSDFRLAGDKYGVYTDDQGDIDPYWEPEPGDPNAPELVVPNEYLPDLHKEMWLLVDYIDRDRSGDPGIVVLASDGVTYAPDEVLWSDNGGQVRLHWTLDNQPAWEKVIFPNTSYQDLYDISRGLGGPVKDWNLATICVPEPASLCLLFIGGLLTGGLAMRRRRRMPG